MDRDRLETLRDGTMSPQDALAEGRGLVDSEIGRDALEDGGRDWLIALARNEGSSTEAAQDLSETFRRFAALGFGLSPQLEVDPQAAFAIRMTVCADIAADLAAFEEGYAVQALRGLPHFEACLTLLYRAPGQAMSRADLIRSLGLKEANGTRVIKALEKAGLVARHAQAGGKRVDLTSRGRHAICSWLSPVRGEVVDGPILVIKTPIAGMESRIFSAKRALAAA